jgi:hypothetical protein
MNFVFFLLRIFFIDEAPKFFLELPLGMSFIFLGSLVLVTLGLFRMIWGIVFSQAIGDGTCIDGGMRHTRAGIGTDIEPCVKAPSSGQLWRQVFSYLLMAKVNRFIFIHDFRSFGSRS